MTLAEKLLSLRQSRKMSMAQVCEPCGLHRSMLFKIEKKGGLPTAATLSIILKTGFGIKEESPAWKEFWALWTNERMGESTGSFRPQELVNKLETQKISNHVKGDAVIAAISKLSQSDFNQLELVLRRPAVLAGLAALNAAYDAGKKSRRD